MDKTTTKKKRHTLNTDLGVARLEKIETIAAELGIKRSAVIARAVDEFTMPAERRKVRSAYEEISGRLFYFGKLFNGALLHLGNMARKIGEMQASGELSDKAGAKIFEAMGHGEGAQINMNDAVSIVPETATMLRRYEQMNPALSVWDAMDE